MYVKGEATPIFIRFHGRMHLQHRIANGDSAVAPVGVCKKFCFNDPSAVCEGHELHDLSCDLVMQPLFDDESTANHTLADEFRQAVH
jgi:hypothetical protein